LKNKKSNNANKHEQNGTGARIPNSVLLALLLSGALRLQALVSQALLVQALRLQALLVQALPMQALHLHA